MNNLKVILTVVAMVSCIVYIACTEESRPALCKMVNGKLACSE